VNVVTMPARRAPPPYVSTETIEDRRWNPILKGHPAFLAGTLENYETKSGDELRALLEGAGLNTSACESREALVALLETSIQASRPEHARGAEIRGHSATFQQRASSPMRRGSPSRQESPSRTKLYGKTSTMNLVSREHASPKKTRLATADLGAIMHGYFLHGIPSAKHTVSCDVPRYKVDLDAPPEVRWNRVIGDFSRQIPSAMQEVERMLEDAGIKIPRRATDFFLASSEASAACAEEIMALSEQLGVAPAKVITMQVAYEFLGGSSVSTIAPSKEGPPLMVRSLDWCRLTDILRRLTIEVDFQRDGRSVFIASSWAGYLGVATGMKPGAFSVSLNPRPQARRKPAKAVAWPVGILLRKVLSDEITFTDAVAAISAAPTILPCFVSVAGTRQNEGVVISRLEDRADSFQRLGDGGDSVSVAQGMDKSTLWLHSTLGPKGHDFLGSKIEGSKCLVQTNSEGSITAGSKALADYNVDVDADNQRQMFVHACLSSLDGSGYTLDELWSVVSSSIISGEDLVYTVSTCPAVAEYTTRVQVPDQDRNNAGSKWKEAHEACGSYTRSSPQRPHQDSCQQEAGEGRHYLDDARESRRAASVSRSRPRQEGVSKYSSSPYRNSRATVPNSDGGPLSFSEVSGMKICTNIADIGRGTTWKTLKDQRSMNTVAPTDEQEPRWPATQCSVPSGDAAGRQAQIQLARNKTPGRYRFGGEIDPFAAADPVKVKGGRRNDTHGAGARFSLDQGGLFGRAPSPCRPKQPAPERPPVLQEAPGRPDTMREFEKSLLTLVYHGRIQIHKGGEEGREVTPREIRNGYRIADNDWVDFGEMVATHQAMTMFGSDQARLATMRPHSGYDSNTASRRNSPSRARHGTKHVLPYQQYPDQEYQKHQLYQAGQQSHYTESSPWRPVQSERPTESYTEHKYSGSQTYRY